MKNILLKCIALGSLALFASAAVAQAADARVLRITNPQQSIGIHIGDVLSRRIEIEVSPPYQISNNALPLKGSIQNGIELADMAIHAEQQNNHTLYTIELRYQVFANAPTPVVLQLPAESIALTGGPKAAFIQIPVWRFWFSPLVAANIRTAKDSLQPQFKPALVDSSQDQARLAAFLGLAIVGLFGLIYVNADGRWLPFMNGAFAQAHRGLRKLRKNKSQKTQALFCMHQAFNKIHGATLFAGDIASFVAAHPEFSRARAEIESFFERSGKALFAEQNDGGEALVDDLIALSRRLRDCERGAS
jgi:mxaA protein